MAIVGLNLAETWEFTLPEDKENPTVWILGMLDGLLMLDLFYDVNQIVLTKNLVRYGLRGWRNLIDEKGKEIPYKTKKVFAFGEERVCVDDDVLKLIPSVKITKIGNEIGSHQRLTEDERKN